MAHFHAFCTDCSWNEKFDDLDKANTEKANHSRKSDHSAFVERHETDDD